MKLDLPTELIKYFFANCYCHRIRLIQSHLGDMREYVCDPSKPPPPPTGSHASIFPDPVITGNTTHIVEMENMKVFTIYENGWQSHLAGVVRILFAPYTTVEFVPPPLGSPGDDKIPQLVTSLRVQYMSFSTLGQQLLVPYDVMDSHLKGRQVPAELVQEIMDYGAKRCREEQAATGHDSHGDREGRRSKRLKSEAPDADETSRDDTPATDDALDNPAVAGGAHVATSTSREPPPQFLLPRPRMTAFRFINEYGIPTLLEPHVAVRGSHLTIRFMNALANFCH